MCSKELDSIQSGETKVVKLSDKPFDHRILRNVMQVEFMTSEEFVTLFGCHPERFKPEGKKGTATIELTKDGTVVIDSD